MTIAVDLGRKATKQTNKKYRGIGDTGDGSPRKHYHCRAHYVFTYFYCFSSVARQ